MLSLMSALRVNSGTLANPVIPEPHTQRLRLPGMTPIRAIIIVGPASGHQHQKLDRRLPFRQVGFLFRQGAM